MSPRRARAPALLLAVLGACGWHAGVAAPPGVGSVGLEVFGNDSLETGLAPRLDGALSRSLQDLVQAPLVAPARADAVVRGRITQFHRRDGVRTLENQLLETGVLIEVEAALVERASGLVLRTAQHRIWSGYVLTDEVDEHRAEDRALENLAQRLVLELFRPVD